MGVAAVVDRSHVFGCSSTGVISVDGGRQYSWSSVEGTSLELSWLATFRENSCSSTEPRVDRVRQCYVRWSCDSTWRHRLVKYFMRLQFAITAKPELCDIALMVFWCGDWHYRCSQR